MISKQVNDRLNQVFSHPAASQARRTSGEGYVEHEAHREIDVFHYVKSEDDDRDGRVDLHHPGHSMAVPSRRTAEYQGCPQTGSMHRVDGLFLTSTNTHAEPNFQTYTSTTFRPDGIEKREASFGGDQVVARRICVNHLDPSRNYVEEFRFAP